MKAFVKTGMLSHSTNYLRPRLHVHQFSAQLVAGLLPAQILEFSTTIFALLLKDTLGCSIFDCHRSNFKPT